MTRLRIVPWVVVVLAAASWVGAIVLAIPRVTRPLTWADAMWGLSFLGLTATGAVVVSRQPRNRFGWSLLLGSFGVALGVLAADYGNRIGEGMPWPAGGWAWHLGEVVFAVAFALLITAFYRFPDGELLPGRLWKAADALARILVVASGLVVLFDPTPGVPVEPGTWQDPDIFWPTPLDAYLPLVELNVVANVVQILVLVLGLGAFASLFVRHRKGTVIERAQLRWVVWPLFMGLAVITPVLVYDALVVDRLPVIVEVIPTLAFTLGIPAGIFMAITKTGLYEIDRLIRRTVAYAIVTATLVAVYAAAVLGIGQVARALGANGNDLIVALSTLVAAAVSRPLLMTVRGAVDRRFHRAGRDAVRTVTRFRGQLRDDISAEVVRNGLVSAVHETLHPEFVGIWVREPAPGSKRTS